MANLGPTLVEIDQRIADIRENLRELVEQAAAFSGAGDQQAQLDRLTKEREDILRQKK